MNGISDAMLTLSGGGKQLRKEEREDRWAQQQTDPKLSGASKIGCIVGHVENGHQIRRWQATEKELFH